MNRRAMLGVTAGAVALFGAGMWNQRMRSGVQDSSIYHEPERTAPSSGMPMRELGATGLKISEVGFGAWGIGGKAYGDVERSEALSALARAEELGCNFVDSALVYGDSEALLGEFLQGRRDRWIVATKYSGQPEGMTATVETQLELLRTDAVDLYQLHWVPRGKDEGLYDELQRLKQAGKARFIGVSLYSADDIDYILKRGDMDVLQLPFNLLEPEPFMTRVRELTASKCGVIVRSTLKEGFLAGKFRKGVTFSDPNDQRHAWSREKIDRTIDQVERFRFLEAEAGPMAVAASRYALSFAAVSTVIMGTKSVAHAESNFGATPGGRLSVQSLARIREVQNELGLGSARFRLMRRLGWAH